jgi:hypothetical protein
MDGGAAYKVALRQLAQTLTSSTIPQDGVAIENKRFASDMTTFKPSPDPLDDQVALKFCDCSDDDDDRSPQ